MSPKSPYPANPVEGVSVSVKPTLELDFDVNAGNICNQQTLNFHRHKLNPNLLNIFVENKYFSNFKFNLP